MKKKPNYPIIKSTLKCLIEMYGGLNELTPLVVAQIQEDLRWYFPTISDAQLTYARNYMNTNKYKNN